MAKYPREGTVIELDGQKTKIVRYKGEGMVEVRQGGKLRSISEHRVKQK